MSEAVPPFDDVREALAFALNFTDGVKAPTMSRMMAQVKMAPSKPSKAQLRAWHRELVDMDKGMRELCIYLLSQQRRLRIVPRKFRSSLSDTGRQPLAGLDRAHLAGYILATFERLDVSHKMVLKGLLLQSTFDCSCGAPCCQRWRRNPLWAATVVETVEYLKSVGDVLRDGKRGLSTQPELRLAIVEQFYTKDERSLTDIARQYGVSMTTAARHREWICEYLAQEENAAWLQLAPIFDQAGITGHIM